MHRSAPHAARRQPIAVRHPRQRTFPHQQLHQLETWAERHPGRLELTVTGIAITATGWLLAGAFAIPFLTLLTIFGAAAFTAGRVTRHQPEPMGDRALAEFLAHAAESAEQAPTGRNGGE